MHFLPSLHFYSYYYYFHFGQFFPELLQVKQPLPDPSEHFGHCWSNVLNINCNRLTVVRFLQMTCMVQWIDVGAYWRIARALEALAPFS